MISDDELNKILAVFRYLNLIDSSYSNQPYRKENAYRTHILLTVMQGKQIKYVFVNVQKDKFSVWQQKNWELRKKINLGSFNMPTNNPEIIHLGFR